MAGCGPIGLALDGTRSVTDLAKSRELLLLFGLARGRGRSGRLHVASRLRRGNGGRRSGSGRLGGASSVQPATNTVANATPESIAKALVPNVIFTGAPLEY